MPDEPEAPSPPAATTPEFVAPKVSQPAPRPRRAQHPRLPEPEQDRGQVVTPLRWASKDPSPTTPPGSPDAATDAGGDASAPAPDADSTAKPAKTTKAGRSRGSFDSAGLRKIFRTLVAVAGTLANQRLVHEQAYRDAGLWLADKSDQEDIGDPLASIASRHGGLEGIAGNPDTEDLIQALAAIAAYVGNHLTNWLNLRAARKKPDAATVAATTEPSSSTTALEGSPS